MGISSLSFYQQDVNWYNQQQSWTSQLSASSGLTSVITSALQNEATGLASIANQSAIQRVNTQIVSTLKGALGSSASSASTSSTGTSSATSGAASSASSASPSTPATTASDGPVSSAPDLQSSSTAASLLAGELPAGSLLSILA
jgi:uncharacterized protein